MRRSRVLPGPLKTLPRRRRGSLLTSFTLFVGAIVATSVVVAAIPGRDPSPTDANGRAVRPGGTEAAGVASSVVTDLTPRKVATREPVPAVVLPTTPAPVTPETVTTGSRHDQTTPLRTLTAAKPVPSEAPQAASSPFRLDLLPVLDQDGTAFDPDYGGLETVDAPPVRTASRAPARRAPAHRDPSAEAIRLPQP